MAPQRKLLASLTLLLLSEALHIAATLLNRGQPAAHHNAGPAVHVTVLIVTLLVMVWVARGLPGGAVATAVLGGGVALAAVVYHVLPADLGFNNPVAVGGTTLQWVSVAVGIVAGLVCVATGVRAITSQPRHTAPAMRG